MIIVDNALQSRHDAGNPVRMGIVGAGYMGRGIALQVLTSITGMDVVAIANRTVSEAVRAYSDAGVGDVRIADTAGQIEQAINDSAYVATDDAFALCEADGVDVIIEATGEIEFGARVVLSAIENGKHVVLMNAELDATLGPILNSRAHRAGVVFSNSDGDEPGVAMNLLRFVRTIGFEPVMAGNLKGFYDPYRTPETQRGFAEAHGQKPKMITSFADGTKLSTECTVLANAAGFGVQRRGMVGYDCDHVKDILALLDPDELLAQHVVDFALGAKPGTGAFVVGYNDHPVKKKYMEYFKMGEGPLYLFYTPFHLPHLQVPMTAARAVLFGDPAVQPIGAPTCDAITVAKRDLKAGDVLDGIGGYDTYGMIENTRLSVPEGLLPIGLSEGCTLVRDISKDETIAYGDVTAPRDLVSFALRREQDQQFFGVVQTLGNAAAVSDVS